MTVAAWYHPRCTIFDCEIAQRPDGVKLWFDVFRNVIAPAEPISVPLQGLEQFVTVRGGGYFFLPSLTALGTLSR